MAARALWEREVPSSSLGVPTKENGSYAIRRYSVGYG